MNKKCEEQESLPDFGILMADNVQRRRRSEDTDVDTRWRAARVFQFFSHKLR